LSQHGSFRSPHGESTSSRHRWIDPEVTDIIPFNEFGSLDDLDFYESSPFDTDAQVLRAPELDDLNDTDVNLTPLRLITPTEYPAVRSRARSRGTGSVGAPVSGGQHRKEATTANAVKGRLMIAAMATGAVAAAAHAAAQNADAHTSETTVLAADQTSLEGATIQTTGSGVQLVSVTPATNTAVHTEEFAHAAAFAQERADREARQLRPLYVMPTKGIWTSGFGYRWGVLHGGIDLAGPIGTPIYAATDGVVIDAGPTAGYGAWVKLRHADGTVTLYGHVNTWVVSIGERVMAGDQIATIGNRGNSTGPHLHFEVLLNGTNRVDPVPWLAKRGLSPGSYVG
jgi:murein DD-endopeptidase MepM/ murein hydrolase activator NlpD